ncbi:hypothetical protein BGZ59_004711 [Podila verticillata]|nr:hypothetical protein BGZ59_004711 [Podila verticillata]
MADQELKCIKHARHFFGGKQALVHNPDLLSQRQSAVAQTQPELQSEEDQEKDEDRSKHSSSSSLGRHRDRSESGSNGDSGSISESEEDELVKVKSMIQIISEDNYYTKSTEFRLWLHRSKKKGARPAPETSRAYGEKSYRESKEVDLEELLPKATPEKYRAKIAHHRQERSLDVD